MILDLLSQGGVGYDPTVVDKALVVATLPDGSYAYWGNAGAIPSSVANISSVTVFYRRLSAGNLYLRFTASLIPLGGSGAVQQVTGSYATYAGSGTDGNPSSITIPSSVFSSLTPLTAGYLLGIAIERDASAASDTYSADFQLISVQVDFAEVSIPAAVAASTVPFLVLGGVGYDPTVVDKALPVTTLQDSNYAYASDTISVPSGNPVLDSLTIYYRRLSTGNLYLRFTVSVIPSGGGTAVSSVTSSYALFAGSGTDGNPASITIPFSLFSSLSPVSSGYLIGVGIERDATNALDTYSADFEIIAGEAHLTPTIPVVAATSALSRNWTVARFFRQAVRDLNLPAGSPFYSERFDMINRAVEAFVTYYFPLVVEQYYTSIMFEPAPSDQPAEVDLSSVMLGRLARTVPYYLTSSLITKNLRYLPYDHFVGFRTGSSLSKNSIVYSIKGDSLFANRGSGLSSYGTLTFRYPRMPIQVASDSDYLDLPDGAPIELALIKLKEIILERMEMPARDFSAELNRLLGTLGVQQGAIRVKEDKVVAMKEAQI